MEMFKDMEAAVRTGKGFFAALDQSGGSTPKALEAYGVPEDAYENEAEMFDKVHAMRSRIMADPAFDGKRVIAAILFEGTMDRFVENQPTPVYLWQRKHIVPFVKVDEGLDEASDGVQLMKPMTKLDGLLSRAVGAGVFGTKMRSVIHEANAEGIEAVVAQQFEIAQQIIEAGLVPIIEPEVSIKSKQKADAEQLLLKALERHLQQLPEESRVIFKLTPPEEADFYAGLIKKDAVLRVVALSGGYSREEAIRRLSENHGVIASFSRALLQDLRASQSDEEFSRALDRAIGEIYNASLT